MLLCADVNPLTRAQVELVDFYPEGETMNVVMEYADPAILLLLPNLTEYQEHFIYLLQIHGAGRPVACNRWLIQQICALSQRAGCRRAPSAVALESELPVCLHSS